MKYGKEIANHGIGLFDSGLGGLTVLREIRTTAPNESLIYLGDTARTPYGSKGAATIKRYSRECADFLLTKNIKLLVVACNTASAWALTELSDHCSCAVIGTVEPAVKSALTATKNGRIAVLGTRATVASQVYEKRLRKLDSKLQVFSQPCPLFVPLVEEGIYSGQVVDAVVPLYLSELREREIDTVILGCTHYPLLANAIQDYLGPEVKLVECSKAIANEVNEFLNANELHSSAVSGVERYFVTDEVSRFNGLAQHFLKDVTVNAVAVAI